jgi:hypothetical protein
MKFMSQAKNSTTLIRSRRAVLAGIASAAVLPIAAATLTTALTAVPAVDPAFALIAEKRAADIAHGEAIDVCDLEDLRDRTSDAAIQAQDNSEAACHAVFAIDWKLARTVPTTLAGVAAVLRFANEIEDAGNEWPDTDTVGREGWHYQLRATIAAAIEVINRQVGV